MGLQVFLQLLVRLARFERHEDGHGLPLQFVGPANRGGFGHVRMADQGALDLDRAEPVPRDVQHVVDAAHDPVVAVRVLAAVVAGQVHVRHFAPIRLLTAVVVAPDAAQHAGPGLGDHQPAALPGGTGLPWWSTMAGTMPGSGLVQLPGLVAIAPGSGLIMMPPVSVCHQVSTIGQRSPPILR